MTTEQNAGLTEVHAFKGKAIPLQTWTGPEGSRRLRLPDFNRTHDPPACRAVPQPTAPPRNPKYMYQISKTKQLMQSECNNYLV
jgi:hypothetical protein